MGVYNKLAIIQRELVAPKGNYNTFGKYNYRSCEDILKALKPLCDANNCVCFITNDMEQIGSLNYVKATVTFVDLESGENVVSTAHAREEETKKGMDGSQITGASSSYARKYALAGLFCIDNEKDSDATNKGEENPKSDDQQKVLAVVKAKTELLKVINDKGLTVEEVCKRYGITTPIDAWNVTNFEAVKNRLLKESK